MQTAGVNLAIRLQTAGRNEVLTLCSLDYRQSDHRSIFVPCNMHVTCGLPKQICQWKSAMISDGGHYDFAAPTGMGYKAQANIGSHH